MSLNQLLWSKAILEAIQSEMTVSFEQERYLSEQYRSILKLIMTYSKK